MSCRLILKFSNQENTCSGLHTTFSKPSDTMPHRGWRVLSAGAVLTPENQGHGSDVTGTRHTKNPPKFTGQQAAKDSDYGGTGGRGDEHGETPVWQGHRVAHAEWQRGAPPRHGRKAPAHRKTPEWETINTGKRQSGPSWHSSSQVPETRPEGGSSPPQGVRCPAQRRSPQGLGSRESHQAPNKINQPP